MLIDRSEFLKGSDAGCVRCAIVLQSSAEIDLFSMDLFSHLSVELSTAHPDSHNRVRISCFPGKISSAAGSSGGIGVR